MKKTVYIAIAALALAACSKDINPRIDITPASNIVTISAGFEQATKTAYDQDGKFSWVAGDKIGVLCSNGELTQQVAFTTSQEGPIVQFSGEVPEGFTVGDIATYPFTGEQDGYARNDFAYESDAESANKGSFRIWGSVKPDLASPLSSMPLTGKKDAEGFFQFKSAMGAVKFTVVNAPKEMAYAYLEVPSDSQAVLNGWFNLDENGSVLMSNAVEPWKNRYNWNAPTDYNQTLDFYFFIPVGVLPAGTKFELCSSSWAAMNSFVFQSDVEVVRNKVTEIAAITLEPVSFLSLEDVLGTYEMTVSSGPYSSNHEPGDLVLEASDDATKGNIMMTKFAGISGKQYGTFDGIYIVFPMDQIFGPNPYADAADKPYVAIDFYRDGVVDAKFQLIERGKIQAIEADAMGLRSCTEEDWLQNNHGGGWPWVLCFGSIYAEWPTPTVYEKGKEIKLKANMINASDVCDHDGQGVAGLVDNNPSTYWHSNWSKPVEKNDPLYGIYFDITLDQEIDAFQFKYQVRENNPNSRPTHVVYGVSKDGENWVSVGDYTSEDMVNAGKADWVTLNVVKLDGSYKYIRLGISDSSDGNEGSLTGDLSFSGSKKCVNMAELKLFWAE